MIAFLIGFVAGVVLMFIYKSKVQKVWDWVVGLFNKIVKAFKGE